MTLLLLACAPSPADTASDPAADAATVLVELATEVTTDLFLGVHFAVGEDALWAMADGEALTGSLALPDDADPGHWETDGELDAHYTVTSDFPDPDGVRAWEWDLAVDLAALALPSAGVAGEAAWTARWEQYDYVMGEHTWTGTLAIDGAEPVGVSFTAHGTWSALNALDGTIDGESVSWENPEPDVP